MRDVIPVRKLCSVVWMFWLGLFGAQAAEIKLLVPAGYLPGIPVLARVEVRTANGQRNWDLWDAAAVLASDNAAVVLSTNRVKLYNGLGSTLVTITGTADFNLTASMGSLQTTRALRNLSSAPVTTVSGTLPGSATTWTGVMRVTADVTIPNGHTLTISSNTLVLVDGVGSGSTAPDFFVGGSVMSLGTEDHPVTITCSAANQNWGQIRHTNAQPSLYRFTTITRGGRATAEGHTGSGPLIRPSNSQITFEGCSLTDVSVGNPTNTIGKILFGGGGANAALVFDNCLLARARMGPEIQGTAVLLTNSYITEMFGLDDADGIYLLTQGAGQQIKLVDSVFAFGQDDGIDTLGSTITVEHCIVRDWNNPNEDAKGVTVFSGETKIWNCLIVDCAIGVSSKSSGTGTATTRIDRSTIRSRDRAVAAENKAGGAPDATIFYFVTNCILSATAEPTNTVYTDYEPEEIQIRYSNIAMTWPGVGNINLEPAFVDPSTNFHLRAESPCIDAGDPVTPSDPDATRADMGYFPYVQPPPQLSSPRKVGPGTFAFTLQDRTNHVYAVSATSDFLGWIPLGTVTNTTENILVQDLAAPPSFRFYRAQRQR